MTSALARHAEFVIWTGLFLLSVGCLLAQQVYTSLRQAGEMIRDEWEG